MLQRVLSGLLIGLFALIPLAVFPWIDQPSRVKETILVLIVALAILGWVWQAVIGDKLRVELSWLNLILALNVLIWLVSLYTSSQRDQGLLTVGTRMAGLGLLLLIPVYLSGKRQLGLAVGLLLSAVTLMSIYGLFQFFHLDPFRRTEGLVGHFRVCSTTNHPNVFVSVLVACVPLNLAAFRLWDTSRRLRVLLTASLVLCIGAAVATFSRAGLGAMAVAVAFYLVASHWRASAMVRWRLLIKTGAGLAVVAGLLLLAVWRGALDPGERQRLLSLDGPTVTKRVHIYRAGLAMAAAEPIWGHGPGRFSHLLPGYRSNRLAKFFPHNRYQVEHAVSEPLEVLVESGVPGLVGWLLLVGMFVFWPLARRNEVSDPGLKAVMVGAAAGVLGLVIHGLVEVNLRFLPPGFLFWALPGLALAAAGSLPRKSDVRDIFGWPDRLAVSVVLCTVFGLILAMSLSSFASGIHLASGGRAQAQDRLRAAGQSFRSALSAWSANLPARYRLAYVLWQQGRLDEAEAQYRWVLQESPFYFDANHNLAAVLLQRGRVEEAARQAEVATRINPFHVPSHDLSVRLALLQGQLKRAEELALYISWIAAHDVRAKVVLARVRLAQGRVEDARGLLEAALKMEPNDEEIRRLLARAR